MLLSPPLRKLALSAHVISSVGWVGALTVFLAHSVASLVSNDVHLVRAVCLAMGLTAWFVILPFSLASLGTGFILALGTAWGLFRHYWVLVKLLLTLVATAVLLAKLTPISSLAAASQALVFTAADLLELKASLLAHAAGGLVVLLVVTVLAIYKPLGITRHGAKVTHTEVRGRQVAMPRWVKAVAVSLLVLVLAIMGVLHGTHSPITHLRTTSLQ